MGPVHWSGPIALRGMVTEMACCNNETFAYPSWWDSATTVRIDAGGNHVYSGPKGDVEFLPQGVAFLSDGDPGRSLTDLRPWSQVSFIRMLS